MSNAIATVKVAKMIDEDNGERTARGFSIEISGKGSDVVQCLSAVIISLAGGDLIKLGATMAMLQTTVRSLFAGEQDVIDLKNMPEDLQQKARREAFGDD